MSLKEKQLLQIVTDCRFFIGAFLLYFHIVSATGLQHKIYIHIN